MLASAFLAVLAVVLLLLAAGFADRCGVLATAVAAILLTGRVLAGRHGLLMAAAGGAGRRAARRQYQ